MPAWRTREGPPTSSTSIERGHEELVLKSDDLRRLANDPNIGEYLFVGLRQTVKRRVNGGVFVLADDAVDFVDRDTDANGEPIPITDERNNTTAGVRCDLMRPTEDTGKREKQIKERPRNLMLNIRYERLPSPERATRQREREEGRIGRCGKRKTMVCLNARPRIDIRPEVGTGASICWRADDPDMYQFG